MPCMSTLQPGVTLAQRMAQVKASLRRLEVYLTTGQVQIAIGPNGAVAFRGWTDRDDVTDVCAYRTLSAESSWALRKAVAKAEATQGRKVNVNAVREGVHSHDGGRTWNPGHK